MADHGGDKTEKPTEKRLREAHAEGQFARAPEIQVVACLAAAFFCLIFVAKQQAVQIAELSVGILSHLGHYAIKPEGIGDWVSVSVFTMLGLILPTGLTCAGIAILAGAAQTRFRITPKVLGFKLDRLNPAAGLKRVFSKQGAVKLGVDGLKLIVVGWIMYGAITKILSDPIFYAPVAPYRLGSFIYSSALALLSRSIFALGGVALLNYLYQQHKTQGDLMMTKTDLKEERRSAEGDPNVKVAMRHMARRLMRRQMLAAVSTADVVITNPTHFAVALKYDRQRDKAPLVLAKGEGSFARRIKAIASTHEVPMIENKPIARLLFKHGRVGHTVPLELYQAVAEILAFVYKTHRYYFHRLKARRGEQT